MKVLLYSAKSYDKEYFSASNAHYKHELRFVDDALTLETVDLVQDAPVVCVFVNDDLSQPVLSRLSRAGVKLIALRCAGFNNVDIQAACDLGIKVVHVPAYSPNAVAEHAVTLMLALNRKIIQANERVRKGNFSLEGLLGFDFSGRTLGVVGTGKIGSIVARIMIAMGMDVLAYDISENPACKEMGVVYVSLDKLLQQSDVISLHCPLTEHTRHLINAERINRMKPGVMLINTSRGAVIDSCALIEGLETGQIGYLGMDVYEHEQHLFFRDLSCAGIHDDTFKTLLNYQNVLITAHQAFFTSDALENIANTSLQNISQFERGIKLDNEVQVA